MYWVYSMFCGPKGCWGPGMVKRRFPAPAVRTARGEVDIARGHDERSKEPLVAAEPLFGQPVVGDPSELRGEVRVSEATDPRHQGRHEHDLSDLVGVAVIASNRARIVGLLVGLHLSLCRERVLRQRKPELSEAGHVAIEPEVFAPGGRDPVREPGEATWRNA